MGIRKRLDLDFRGTLAVAKEVPVGLTAIRLAERYCVVLQTLTTSPKISVSSLAR